MDISSTSIIADIFDVLKLGIIGWVSAIGVNYFADTASQIPYSWKPTCDFCGHGYSLQEFLFGGNCPKCSAKRATRYFLVFAIVLIFHFGAWNNIDLIKMDAFHFIGVVEFFLLGLLLDLRYHRVPLWLSLIGLPLSISVSTTQFGTHHISAISGGLISIAFATVVYIFVYINFKIAKSNGLDNISKPDPGIIAWAAVAGIMVGYPRILFSAAMVLYILGLTALASLAIRIYNIDKKKDEGLIPYGTIIILSTLITYIIAV